MTNTMAIDSGIHLVQFSYPLTWRVYAALFCNICNFSACVCCRKSSLNSPCNKKGDTGGGIIIEEGICLSFKGYNCLTTTIIWIKLINVLNTLPIALRCESDIFLLTHSFHDTANINFWPTNVKWYSSICGLSSDFFIIFLVFFGDLGNFFYCFDLGHIFALP